MPRIARPHLLQYKLASQMWCENMQVLQLRVLTAGRPAALAIDTAAALQLRRAEVSLMAAAHRKACRSLPGHGSTLECVRVRPVLICMGVCLGVYVRALERESTRCVMSAKGPCGAPGHKVSGVCKSIRCLAWCLVLTTNGCFGSLSRCKSSKQAMQLKKNSAGALLA